MGLWVVYVLGISDGLRLDFGRGHGPVTDQSLTPDLALRRMQETARDTFFTTAATVEPTDFVLNGNRVTVDPVTALGRAGCPVAAEFGDNYGGLLGALAVARSDVTVTVSSKVKATGREPDTGGLIVRIGDDRNPRLRCNFPAYSVEPRHHRRPLVIRETGAVIHIRAMTFQGVGPRLCPEIVLREKRTLHEWRCGRTSGSGSDSDSGTSRKTDVAPQLLRAAVTHRLR